MEPLYVRAYAKVNLTLEVLGRRPDGFHRIATVLQTVGLWDDLFLFPLPHGVEVECSEASLSGEANLVFRAARLLRGEEGVGQGVRIVVCKGIPVASGLGGGSSDAAAALRGLARLWGLPLSHERLAGLAARLGSDVPFFLRGGTALAQGRGEEITPLPPLGETWFVLLSPPLGGEGKTARLYSLLPPDRWTDGSPTARLVDALRKGEPLHDGLLFNAFEAVAFEAFPGLPEYWRGLEEAAGSTPHLTGTGPSLFTLAPSPARAQEIALALRRRGWRAWAVPPIRPAE
jgi:4-diphosphocytidyl-2-C-methyl-D-erythritol kinase